jgi:hypothetical protein
MPILQVLGEAGIPIGLVLAFRSSWVGIAHYVSRYFTTGGRSAYARGKFYDFVD